MKWARRSRDPATLDQRDFHMPNTMRSQATTDQETISTDMEAQIVEMEEKLKKVMTTMESHRRENEDLKHRNAKLSEPMTLSQGEQPKREAQSAGGMNRDELEKKRLHDELRNLVDKYGNMAKKMGGSSSVEQLLNRTDLPYSAR